MCHLHAMFRNTSNTSVIVLFFVFHVSTYYYVYFHLSRSLPCSFSMYSFISFFIFNVHPIYQSFSAFHFPMHISDQTQINQSSIHLIEEPRNTCINQPMHPSDSKKICQSRKHSSDQSINHPINSVWVVPSPTVTCPGACDLLAVRGGKRKKPQDLALIPPKGRKVELGELSDLSAVAFLDKWFPFSYFIFFSSATTNSYKQTFFPAQNKRLAVDFRRAKFGREQHLKSLRQSFLYQGF